MFVMNWNWYIKEKYQKKYFFLDYRVFLSPFKRIQEEVIPIFHLSVPFYMISYEIWLSVEIISLKDLKGFAKHIQDSSLTLKRRGGGQMAHSKSKWLFLYNWMTDCPETKLYF